MRDFTKGIIVGILGVTTLTVASDVIATFGELVKAHIGIEINKCNQVLRSMEEPESKVHAIGFQIPSEEDDDYDE